MLKISFFTEDRLSNHVGFKLNVLFELDSLDLVVINISSDYCFPLIGMNIRKKRERNKKGWLLSCILTGPIPIKINQFGFDVQNDISVMKLSLQLQM
jgi:hypothetical protein